jgi:PilZ domain-containing protein
MQMRKSHRISHDVGANVRTLSPFGQRVDYTGRVTDVSVSGMRIVVDDHTVSGVCPGTRARWRVRQKGAANLEGAASVVRSRNVESKVFEECVYEIVLEFNRPRYDIVTSITNHEKVEIDLDLLLAGEFGA